MKPEISAQLYSNGRMRRQTAEKIKPLREGRLNEVLKLEGFERRRRRRPAQLEHRTIDSRNRSTSSGISFAVTALTTWCCLRNQFGLDRATLSTKKKGGTISRSARSDLVRDAPPFTLDEALKGTSSGRRKCPSPMPLGAGSDSMDSSDDKYYNLNESYVSEDEGAYNVDEDEEVGSVAGDTTTTSTEDSTTRTKVMMQLLCI
ncbi:hypothetical protein CJ030_MR4G022471 [Morella rubra]|uniref:Uncharacterized protein n=1 Tax=Morella rubra TaxID=262757 RepID=A0A6A1VWW5_9ROSI|nr:hypothetical protein CJ030_MR4G022471 [Morella rubra]